MTSELPTLPRHPIGVVAERTGLSLDVLRVWERRYGVVRPARAGGKRLYSDADVERLRLLHRATAAGRSVGQVVRLATGELEELVREDEAARRRVELEERRPSPASPETDVERALALARALDGPGLEGLLRRRVAVLGMAVFLDALAAPLLRRIEDERRAGRLTTARERVATLILRRVLDGAVLSLVTGTGASNLLVATPEGERHELEAVLVAAVAAVEGWRVTYLGTDLPAAEIVAAAIGTAADAVGVSVTEVADRERLLAELQQLRAELPPAVPLLVGGAGAALLAGELEGAGIFAVESLADLRAVLRQQRPTPSPA